MGNEFEEALKMANKFRGRKGERELLDFQAMTGKRKVC